MAKQNKVAVNLAQDFTDAEKAQARQNIGAGTAAIEYSNGALPPTVSEVNKMTVIGDGRVRFDNRYSGIIPSEPGQSDKDKVLVANYAGSPAIGTGVWKDIHSVGIREVVWVDANTSYADVKKYYDAGNLVLRKTGSVDVSMANSANDDTIYFTSINSASTIKYSYSINASTGWYSSVSYLHNKVNTGICNVNNLEAHDFVLGLNNAEWTPYANNEDILTFDYFSYHAGSFGVTPKYTGQLWITGTRHNWCYDVQTPIDELLNINIIQDLTKDTRSILAGSSFSLSTQELAKNDYRIDWDLNITYRQGPFQDQSYSNWWAPIHVKISRTPDFKIMTGA